jgi:hypothetical protein
VKNVSGSGFLRLALLGLSKTRRDVTIARHFR